MGGNERPYFGGLAAASGDPRPFRSAAAERLDAVLAAAVAEGKRERPMSKLAALAQRISATKLRHEKQADALAARLDTLDAVEPTVFSAAEAAIAACATDLNNLEADMRLLSNAGPLPGKADGSSGG